jgi:hypothetical protein
VKGGSVTTIAEQAEEYLQHFTPSTKQRRQFSKAGVAMPDGSFYIRNASDLTNAINSVGRATPNASESDTARRNSVRRHVMARARALKLSHMIPNTWNSDGSLKQSDMISQVTDFLAHHGVLGMKWGVRRARSTGARGPSDHKGPSGSKSAPAAPNVKVGKHAAKKAAKKAAQIQNVDKQIVDMKENLKVLEANEKIMLGHLKKDGEEGRTLANPDVRERLFIFNEITINVEKQQKEIAKMEKFREKLTHSDDFDEEIEDFLAHFGVRGMKWGVHRARTSSPHPSSSEAATARQLHVRARSSGTHSLTNAELQTLVQRMNLESQYSNLNQRQVSKGRKIVGDLLLEIGKQTAKQLIIKGGEKGAQTLIKKMVKK